MRFGSVCSGIEAASVAFEPLGWKASWLAEIEPFPSAVLKHHYPDVPNLGDMTKLPELISSGQIEAPDLFCGGTPCQAFSVAGLRKSLDDARGNLSLTFCKIADAIDAARSVRGDRPSIVLWENVPGVLSTKDNAFGCFLAGLAGEELPLLPPGGKWTNAGCVLGPQRSVAWRVTDAQYFGVAQRRRRVFVVASARKGFNPAAVLFEFEGMPRHSAPSREAGQNATGTIEASLGRSRGAGTPVSALSVEQPYKVANCLTQRMHKGINTTLDEGQTPVIAFPGNLSGTQCASAENIAPSMVAKNPTAVAMPINTQIATRHHCLGEGTGFGIGDDTDPAFTLTKGHSHAVATASHWDGDYPHPTLNQSAKSSGGVGSSNQEIFSQRGAYLAPGGAMQVRRLTPVECERLQGFPDNYTAIPWRKKPADQCPDGPRYKALGNSWAVPNVRWIGERIKKAVTP